jgi:hypothetical protein
MIALERITDGRRLARNASLLKIWHGGNFEKSGSELLKKGEEE